MSAGLPTPGADEQRRSRQLGEHIRGLIAQGDGWLGFDRYMFEALYAPGLGFYATAPEFGVAGDFVTAPSLGNVTAKCLARQCAEVLANIGGDVLEFGAGDGQLAADSLTAMAEQECLPENYFIMETGAALAARQRQTIAEQCGKLAGRVQHLGRLPDGFTGVVLANEVLDAMPAMRFEMDAGGRAHALGVGLDADGRFCWSPGEALPEALQSRLAEYNLAPGYRSEIPLRAEAWVKSVGEKIATGVMLLIDYGFPAREFYHRERRHGTLMCHYRHQNHDDPFFYPGLQDISTHLDFTALAIAAAQVNMQLGGYASQGVFLLSLGALQQLADAPADVTTGIARQIKQLTLPHEMGELFKAVAFCRNYPHPLVGFSMQDRRDALL